jgi:hypothetical protein
VFAGNRLIAVNTTRDGMNVGEGRYDNGAFSATYTSPDLVEEVRIIVSPADAEAARGSGSGADDNPGGNQPIPRQPLLGESQCGSGCNSWRNNLDGIGKDYLNRNQLEVGWVGRSFATRRFSSFCMKVNGASNGIGNRLRS